MNKQRRKFVQAAAVGGLSSFMGNIPYSAYAQSSGVSGFSDYKALVCVFLSGGNDSWNMIVPTSQSEYDAYNASRGGSGNNGLAIERSSLLEISGNTDGVSYGFHPSMPEMRDLYNDGQCAVIANVGPLVEPTTVRQFRDRTVALPPELFSHNDQEGQWHSLRGDAILASGWGGRVADVLSSQLGGQALPTNISLSGTTLFQAGNSSVPYVMGRTGTTPFAGFTPGSSLSNAFQNIANAEYPNIYQRGFSSVQQRALEFSDLVNASLDNAISFEALPDGNEDVDDEGGSILSSQLRTVAKIISQQSQLSMSRQIFYVRLGGFDTHDNQNVEQPILLSQVSSALSAFYDAMVEIGMQDAVTAYTNSDFGRSLSSNGDGSDHGWGGLHLAVGGSIRGGQIYGDYPSLALGNELDLGRGRIVPTTSCDQYAATLASWFGVNQQNLATVAPCINNFNQNDLGFML